MADVAFVFTNPRHHLEMMAPVAGELRRRGVSCALVSLAELRGFQTPAGSGAQRAIPFNLRRRNQGAPGPAGEEQTWRRGRLAQRLVWRLGLGPRLAWMLRRARVVVVPNDAVFPYHELMTQLRGRSETVLMQEGIRFQPPDGYTGPRYGGEVSGAVCAWGEGSKEFFLAGQVPDSRIAVTGAPRLDNPDFDGWRARGHALAKQHGWATPPLAFLSNPIEIQGYGTKEDKLALFARFLAGAAPVLSARNIPVVVKNHLHEDPRDYARVAAQSPLAGHVTVLSGEPIFAVIGAARAAVVLTSTVGLEALTFGLPLGVLEIPGHEFAFEYVQRGAAVPIRLDSVGAAVEQLLAPDDVRSAAGAAFVRRHLHEQGRARFHVADVIERILARARRPGQAPTVDGTIMPRNHDRERLR